MLAKKAIYLISSTLYPLSDVVKSTLKYSLFLDVLPYLLHITTHW